MAKAIMVQGTMSNAGKSLLLHQLFVHPNPLRRIILVNPLDQNADNTKERQQSHQRLQQKGGDILV